MATKLEVADMRDMKAEDERSAKDAAKYAPPPGKFYQQMTNAWRPVFTPRVLKLQFGVSAFVLLIVGIVTLAASNDLVEVEKRYDDVCALGNASCDVSIEIPEEIKGPVYLYYKLTTFHQNHRQYVGSRDDYQMFGSEKRDKAKIEDKCKYKYKQMACTDATKATEALCTGSWDHDGDGGTAAVARAWIEKYRSPCGLIAASLPTDKFTVQTTGLTMKEKGIAWPSDDDRFNPPACKSAGTCASKIGYQSMYLDEMYPTMADGSAGSGWDLAAEGVENEHFQVWMKTAALASFRKLYGIIDADVPKGTLTVRVDNNFDVSAFGGTKSIVVGNTSWIGGKNGRLGLLFIIVAVIYLLMGTLLVMNSHGMLPRGARPLGDPELENADHPADEAKVGDS
jgi:hypothetical protein